MVNSISSHVIPPYSSDNHGDSRKRTFPQAFIPRKDKVTRQFFGEEGALVVRPSTLGPWVGARIITTQHYQPSGEDTVYYPVATVGNGTNATCFKMISASNTVILKLYKETASQAAIQNATTEYRALDELMQHPHVIKPYGLCQVELHPGAKHVGIFMENAGESLATYLDRIQELPILEIQTIVRQLIETIVALKQKKIAHLDLAPKNMTWNPFEKKLTLIDFGLAALSIDELYRRFRNNQAQTGAYRAPELHLHRAEVDYPQNNSDPYKVEVWSIGCIIAELLSGKILLWSKTLPQVLRSWKNDCKDLRSAYSKSNETLDEVVKSFYELNCLTSLKSDSCPTAEQLNEIEKVNAVVQFVIEKEKLEDPLLKRLKRRLDKVALSRVTGLQQAHADCIDLLEKMLQNDPKDRISLEDAAKHKFLSRNY